MLVNNCMEFNKRLLQLKDCMPEKNQMLWDRLRKSPFTVNAGKEISKSH